MVTQIAQFVSKLCQFKPGCKLVQKNVWNVIFCTLSCNQHRAVSQLQLPKFVQKITRKNGHRLHSNHMHNGIFLDKLSPLVLAEQPKLLSVNMSNNLISEIQPGAFANMTRLVRLILSKNKLTKLDSGSLSGKPFISNNVIYLTRHFIIQASPVWSNWNCRITSWNPYQLQPWHL